MLHVSDALWSMQKMNNINFKLKVALGIRFGPLEKYDIMAATINAPDGINQAQSGAQMAQF
jgi:hypothetical protein